MGEQERWVKVGEVSTHLDVTTDTIYRWIEKKGFLAHIAGRLLRFKLSEVDQWVRNDSGKRSPKRKQKQR